jgi:hypothetical protein
MSLKRHERTAIEAVAKRFSATWEEAGDAHCLYLVSNGKRVAVDIATLKPRGAGQGDAAKIRLRFDKVVARLMESLRATLNETVPDGVTVLVTLTAPIRLPSKTASALEERIRALVGRSLPRRDEKDTIHGNGVRIRLLRDESRRAPKMLGFVHNSDSDPLLLLNMTSGLLELIGAEAGKPETRAAGDRWLVVISRGGSLCLGAYRSIFSQLRPTGDFEKILVVFGDGQVTDLGE